MFPRQLLLIVVSITAFTAHINAFPNFAKLMEPENRQKLIKRLEAADQDMLTKSFGSMFDKVDALKGHIPEAKCKDKKLKGMTTETIYSSYSLYRSSSTTSSSSSSTTSKSHTGHYSNTTTAGDDDGTHSGNTVYNDGDAPRCASNNHRQGLFGLVDDVVGGVVDTVLGGGGEDANHPWQKPGPGDKRGPCPGLNVIANHGYIPRNGIVNPIELLIGTFQGLHLSPDLAAFLAALSMVGMGDLTTMTLSIGGKSGLGDGLNHHGILEGDASVTRGDHYFGNSWDAQPDLVEQFINETNTYGNGNVDVFSLGQSRFRAWEHSRENNPYFDFNPWRVVVAYAESGFVHEVLRGSFEKFDESMIRSWFIEERFPPCWTPRGLPMSIPEILAWASVVFLTKPTVPGWSIGKKGAFVPLPTSDGAYRELDAFFNPATTGATVADLFCAVANAIGSWVPSQITNALGTVGLPKIGAPIICPS